MAARPRRQRRAGRRPELSQHFIRSAAIAERLVALARIEPTDLIIEAGPGYGVLTRALAAAALQVIAIELDRKLYKRLVNELSEDSGVALRHGDFLGHRLPAGDYTFFSNIPFGLTAEIMRKLVFGISPPTRAFVIVESIAAIRFLGQPFGPESELSLRLKARFEPSVVSWLPPHYFVPPPSANAVMLRLEARDKGFLSRSERRDFDRFARSVFRSKNGSSWRTIRKLLSATAARSLVGELGFPANSAPSDISFEHWLAVFRLSQWNRATR